MNKTLKKIKDIEFNQIDYRKESPDYFRILEGNIPILISAPHGARHYRNDGWKDEDEYTASIAIKLGQLTGAHVIYVKNQTQEDSNYIRETKYKDTIKKIIKNHDIKFIADIHGANSKREFKICAGIINDQKEQCSCPTYKSIIEKTFSDFQTPLFNFPGFTASHQNTITYFARYECGIESAQFEIRSDYRIIERKPDSTYAIKGNDPEYKAEEKNVLQLLNHLKEMVFKIKEAIEQ